MKRKVMILGLALAAFTACQKNDEIGLNPGITEISPADLPSSSQTFIDDNFRGEVVTDAYKVTGTDDKVTYEAFMTNNTNLVFHEDSDLSGFGNINSRMGMEGEMFDGGMQNMGMFGNGNMTGNGSGGMMGNGNGGMMSNGNGNGYGGMMGDHEFRDHPEAMPNELDISEIPSEIINYLDKNYPDKDILMAFEIEMEDELAEYQVLIQDVGGMIFDKDGNFQDMIRRGMGHCENYDEMTVEDLPENIQKYIETNYPEDDILRVRLGSNDDYKEIQVLIENVGILIFDTDGKFVKLMERRRSHRG